MEGSLHYGGAPQLCYSMGKRWLRPPHSKGSPYMIDVRRMSIAMLLAACATRTAPPPPELSTMELLSLESKWMAAVVTHDRRALDRMLADDFIGVTVDGEVHDKAQEIDARMSAQWPSGMRMHGDQEHVVRHSGTVLILGESYRLATPEAPPLDRTKYSSVWRYRDGRWQLASTHYTTVATP